MAQGIPVGVLKAGSSFSASWTALSLNTWREGERQRDWLPLIIFPWIMLQSINPGCLIFSSADRYKHKTTANNPNKFGVKENKRDETSASGLVLSDGRRSVFMADAGRVIYAKPPFKPQRGDMKCWRSSEVKLHGTSKASTAARSEPGFYYGDWRLIYAERWGGMDVCSFGDYTS